MKKFKPLNVLLVAGGLSIVFSLISALVGLNYVDNDGMVGNLLAEMSGVFLEVAIVLLIIDWLIKRNRRKEWDFAYITISKRCAMVFVDIMRLLYVLHADKVSSTNIQRFESFLDVAFQHLYDLRSHIEGFAVAFEPQTHQKCRQIEQRLSWMLGRIKRGDEKYSGLRDFPTMKKLAYSVDSFLQTSSDSAYSDTIQVGQNVVIKYTKNLAKGVDHQNIDTIMSVRLQAQNDLIKSMNCDDRKDSIIDDYDMVLALPYFVIDFLILSRLYQD